MLLIRLMKRSMVSDLAWQGVCQLRSEMQKIWRSLLTKGCLMIVLELVLMNSP